MKKSKPVSSADEKEFKVLADPEEVIANAFEKLERSPLMTVLKASGEYERLMRNLNLPLAPTRATRIGSQHDAYLG